MPDTIDWPAWLEPAEFLPTLIKNALVHRSPFDQAPQVWAAPGEHWAYSLTLPPVPRSSPRAQARTAFLNRIAAGGVRLRVPNFQHRSPHGSLRGAPVLAAALASGADLLSLQGATSGANLLAGGSFEVDSDSNGLADGWTVSTADAARVHNITRTSHAAVDGLYQQSVAITTATTADDTALFAVSRPPVVPGQVYTLSADVRCNVADKVYLLARFYAAGEIGATYIGDSASPALPACAFDTPRLVSHSFTAPAGAATVQLMIRGITSAGEYFSADVLQLQRGALVMPYAGPPTLLAGDYIGAAGQLFEVQADAVLTDTGSGLVRVNNRSRVAIPSGTPITWQAPAALMICPTARLPTSHRPGWQDAIALDLEEVWDA